MALDKPLPYAVALAVVFAAGAFAACKTSGASRSDDDHTTTNQTISPDAAVEAGSDADVSPEAGVVTASLSTDAGASSDPDADPPPPACPDDMFKIGRFCVDRVEPHLVVLGPDGATSLWPWHDQLEKGLHYVAKAEVGFFPQAYISRVQAAEACGHAGKRLCSRAEWSRACKGQARTRYPYGNKGKSGVCNTGKPHLLEKFFGGSRRHWTYEIFNDPKLDQEPGFLAKSGQYEGCRTDEGAFDMVGNLHEWIADDVGDDIEEILAKDEVERKTQPWKVGNGMFMGGFFSTTMEHGPGCTYTTIAHEPTYHDYSTGFRCCMDFPGLDRKSKGKKKKK